MSKGNAPGQLAQRKFPTKRYAPKTRTGCHTCRIRRVKCDEAKPDCARCTSTGRKCDGYSEAPSPGSDASACSPPPSLAHDRCSTALEKKAFDWFRHQTAPILCGHFADETYSRTTLQMYHTEPAMRYTVSAFGVLHEQLYSRRLAREAGVRANLRTHLPAEQYSLALREMQKLLALQEVPLEVVLACSLLLVQFEGFQQSFLSAMIHAEKALSLLCTSNRRVEDSLLRTMMRFDAQSAMHTGRKVPKLASYTSGLDQRLPPALTSSVEARYLVTTLSIRLYAFSQAVADQYVMEPGGLPLEHLARAQELEQIFHRLDHLILAFRQKRGTSLPIREQHGLQILQTRAKLSRIFAATCLYAEATMFDAYLSDFADVLMICTDLMNDDRADRRLFVLHVDEGLMHPLYIVATYCRDSNIRHKAFNLLRELPAGNGLRIWHADVVIRTAKLIIDYEEAGGKDLKCSDIPEWRRVHNANSENWDMSSWHETIGGPLRVRPNGLDGEWMELGDLLDAEALLRVQHIPLIDSSRNQGVVS